MSLSYQIIASRPLYGVSLSLFPEDEYDAIQKLTLSGTPIRRLTIMIIDAAAPTALIPHIAAYLPQLEALHVIAAFVQSFNLVCRLTDTRGSTDMLSRIHFTLPRLY